MISTRSLAVLASLVDATIDLFAQGVLLGVNWIAESGTVDGIYPVGVSRLEAVGVIVVAVVMILGSGGVIYDAGFTLYYYYPDGPDMEFTLLAAIMLVCVVAVKVVVWQIAKNEYEKTNNVSLEALALDNFNDILSNTSSLVFASLTGLQPWTWWFDPIGGILISLYIMRSWGLTGVEQANQLIGIQAGDEVLCQIRKVAESQCQNSQLDRVLAYHFGPKCVVEIKLIMDPSTPLQEIRDASIKLQHQVEAIDECERCFVQVDYTHRENDDHDGEVPLRNKISSARNKTGLRLRMALARQDQATSVVDVGALRRRTATMCTTSEADVENQETEAESRDRVVVAPAKSTTSCQREGR